jgi:hypothetical protein
MKRITTLGLVSLSCLMFASSVFAQETRIPSSFESLQTSLKLRAGERIEITDLSGRKTSGKLESISGSVLTARTGNSTLEFKESGIAEIRHRKPERWWDGMLIGMGVGAASGLATSMSSCGNDSECAFYTSVVLVPTFAGGGAGIGAIIDSLHHKNETVYSRNGGSVLRSLNVAPIVGKDKKGVSVSLSF